MRKLFFLGILSGIILSGCSFIQNEEIRDGSNSSEVQISKDLIQLDFPNNITYEDKNHIIKWDIVDDCAGYKVKINSNVFETKDVSFQITSFKFDQEFYYQVMSIGIPGVSKDSKYSPNIKATFTLNSSSDDNINVPPEDTEHNDEKEETSDNYTAFNDQGNSIEVVETKAIAKPNENYQNPITSYYDDSFNYYIFDLGYLQDVPLETSTQFVKYGGWQGVNTTLEFSRTQTNTSSMQTTTQTVATSMTNWECGTSGSIKFGNSYGNEKLFQTSMEIQVGLSASMGISDTQSWTKTYSLCEEATETMSTKINITFTQDCPTGYYRYALIGDVSVYGVLIQNRITKEYEAYNFTSLNAWGYGLDFSKDRGVIQYGDTKLDFKTDDVLPFLDEPTFYFSKDIQEQVTEQTGEADKPYLIGNAEDISKLLLYNDKGVYFKLTNHIDFAGSDKSYLYEPICFKGILDGNGYTIKNYQLGALDNNDSCGFFLINEGTIKNIIFDNILFSSMTNSEDLKILKAGIVCGSNNGSIINVIVSNSKMPDCIIGEGMYDDYVAYVGGISGVNNKNGTIERCGAVSNEINAKARCGCSSSTCYVGGLVGQNNGKITNVYSRNNRLSSKATGGAALWYKPTASSYSSSLVGHNSKGGVMNYAISNNNILVSSSSGATYNYSYKNAFVSVNNGSASYCYTNDDYNFKCSGNDIKNSKKVDAIALANCSFISKTLWIDSSEGPVINYVWKS